MDIGATQAGILGLIAQSGLVVQMVLLILLAASVVCWAVIAKKYRSLKKATKENSKFLDIFWHSKSLEEIFSRSKKFDQSPIANMFTSGFKELQKLSSAGRSKAGSPEVDNVQRALVRTSNTEIGSLERYLGFLATTASAAPFVGLFGTVWGIMNAFQKIGTTGAANLSVVAPGISEALVATAVGLAAAIPAVVAYNHYVNTIKKIAAEMENFSQDFLNIVQRGLLTGGK